MIKFSSSELHLAGIDDTMEGVTPSLLASVYLAVLVLMTPGGSPFFSLPCRHLFLDACGVDGTCQDFSFGLPELRRDFPEPGWLVASSAFPYNMILSFCPC